jgi:hypothetical protein
LRDLLTKTPAHVWQNHPRLNPNYKPDESAKFDVGKLAHSLFLEGVDCCCVIDPKDYPAGNGNIPKGWTNPSIRAARDVARDAGKVPMLPEEAASVVDMVKAATVQLAESELGIINLRAEGDAERSYVWQEDGIWCRARPDWLSKDRTIALDYKTTSSSANPNAVAKSMANFGYAVQASFYKRGIKAVDGVEPTFIFLFQEVDPPYLCSFIGLSPAWQEIGNQQVNAGIMLWRECIKSGVWPGYTNKVCYPDCPPWILSDWEMKQFDLGAEHQEEL